MKKKKHINDENFMNIRYELWIDKSEGDSKVSSVEWVELTDVHASIEFVGYNERYLHGSFLRLYKSVIDSTKDEPDNVYETACGIKYVTDRVPFRAFENMVRKALHGRLNLNVSASCGDLSFERVDICEWPHKEDDLRVILERTDWALLECLTNLKNHIIYHLHVS